MSFPRQSELELPLLRVLLERGGVAKPRDVYPRLAGHFPDLTPEEQELRLESSPTTRKWANLVQWARQSLVESGHIDGSTRGLWQLTDTGRARALKPSPDSRTGRPAAASPPSTLTLRDLTNHSRDEAKRRLLEELKRLSASGFERFCRELLEQLGYHSVVVTGRTGDGGVDGNGDFRQGAVSIRSAFQAKRWADAPVGRPAVDRFRGAIQGSFDHGVFITTSRFTRDATAASYRKGAITILRSTGIPSRR